MTRNPITDGETVLAPLWGSMMNAHGAEAILDGVAPSVGTGDWDVDTTSGNVFINGTTASVSSDTTTLTAPASDGDLDSGEFRVDLLTVNDSGTINVAEGVAAAEPITEGIPTDEAVICAVIVSGDASGLTGADIRDYRTLLEDDTGRYIDGGPHEIDAAEFAGGDGTAGQILESDGSAAAWVDRPTHQLTFTYYALQQNAAPTVTPPYTAVNRPRNVDVSDFTGGVFRAEFDSGDGSSVSQELVSTQSSTTMATVSTTSTSFVVVEDTSVTVPDDSQTDVRLDLSGSAGMSITQTSVTLTE